MADEYIVQVKANTKSAEKSVDDLGDHFVQVANKIGTIAAGYLSFKALENGLNKAIHSAMEAEAATNAFNAALGLAGKYSEQASLSFRDFADQLEQTTGVQDDLILKNASLLVSIGNLSGEGLERATKAALDLSKGMQVDLGTAFDIVTKATQGNVGALSRYGLEVNAKASDSEKFAAALGFIEARFNGLSNNTINTFEGSITKLGNGFDKIFENLGLMITQNPKVIASVQLLSEVFYKIAASISTSKNALDPFINALFNIGKFLVQYVMTPLEVVWRFFVGNLLNLPIIMLGVFTQVAGVMDKIFGTDLLTKIQTTKDALSSLQTTIVNPVSPFTDDQLFSTRLANSIDIAKTKIDELASKLKIEVPAAGKAASDSIAKSAADIGKSISQGMSQAIATGVSVITNNLLKGKAAFSGFAAAVGNVMGDAAIQIGAMLIATGLGIESLKMLNGFAAIAAGIGLIAIGTILKSFSSGGSPSASSVTPANSGGIPDSGGSFGAEPAKEEERIKAQTGIVVNVQGNILDRRETGLAIAEIINDAFDTNGVLIRANA